MSPWLASHPVRQRWAALARRERLSLLALGLFLLAVLLHAAVWAPVQARLADARTLYQERLLLASQVAAAQPVGRPAPVVLTPAQLSEGASAAGVQVAQLQVEGERLSLSVAGEAVALLTWLEALERNGAVMHSLALSPSDLGLQARLVLSMP